MCGKLEAAAKARSDPDFVLIARCDTIGTVPLEQYQRENMIDEVVRRSNAYAAAGADAIFIMALTEKELQYFAREIRAPLVGVFATVEPLPIAAFERAGCWMTIGSLVGIYAAGKGLVNALRELKNTRDWNRITDLMLNDNEFFDIVGIQKYQTDYRDFRIP
jgi:methylisocitrate lyase